MTILMQRYTREKREESRRRLFVCLCSFCCILFVFFYCVRRVMKGGYGPTKEQQKQSIVWIIINKTIDSEKFFLEDD